MRDYTGAGFARIKSPEFPNDLRVHKVMLGPRSDAIGVDITDILLVLARTSGLKRNVCCVKSPHVKITFSYSSRHDMTKSVVEIPEIGVQLPCRRGG